MLQRELALKVKASKTDKELLELKAMTKNQEALILAMKVRLRVAGLVASQTDPVCSA
jgi:hypothetical protein